MRFFCASGEFEQFERVDHEADETSGGNRGQRVLDDAFPCDAGRETPDEHQKAKNQEHGGCKRVLESQQAGRDQEIRRDDDKADERGACAVGDAHDIGEFFEFLAALVKVFGGIEFF